MEYNINHRPLLNVKQVEEIYSKKDGVPVTYVCTTHIPGKAPIGDIFYRETPHPEYGNKYFTIYNNPYTNLKLGDYYIADADSVENLEFGMIEVFGQYHYSRDRHDFFSVRDYFVDGGRDYFRRGGDMALKSKIFVVRNGKFEVKYVRPF